MNITRYKNIDELIEKKDIYLAQEIGNDELKLISKGYVPTKFNIGVNDVMEFSMYDASNNILTQENFGNVRYIKGETIKDYLLQSNNITDTVVEGGGFVVDIKRLIKEAGYNTGYFRVQINFVNNRVGSDYPTDRMWIQEISTTRSEMRLLPFNNFNETDIVEKDVKKDLNESYDSFVLGKFSGDEVYQEIYKILDRLNASDVSNIMKTVLTEATINKLAQEFNIIGGYDVFYTKVLDDMRKAVVNELLYRNSIIGSNDFGKPISNTLRNKISQKDYNYYTKEEIVELINSKFKESINYNLPKRTLNENIILDNQTKQSLEELRQVVQVLESNNIYQLPAIELERITPTPTFITPTPEIPPIPTPVATPLPNLLFESGPTFQFRGNDVVLQFSSNFDATSKISFLDNLCPTQGCEIVDSLLGKDKNFLLTGLVANTTYKFSVQISTTDGRSVLSAPITFTTLPYDIKNEIYDPYAPTTENTGGGGTRITYVDSDGNPDTGEGSIGNFTQQLK